MTSQVAISLCISMCGLLDVSTHIAPCWICVISLLRARCCFFSHQPLRRKLLNGPWLSGLHPTPVFHVARDLEGLKTVAYPYPYGNPPSESYATLGLVDDFHATQDDSVTFWNMVSARWANINDVQRFWYCYQPFLPLLTWNIFDYYRRRYHTTPFSWYSSHEEQRSKQRLQQPHIFSLWSFHRLKAKTNRSKTSNTHRNHPRRCLLEIHNNKVKSKWFSVYSPRSLPVLPSLAPQKRYDRVRSKTQERSTEAGRPI